MDQEQELTVSVDGYDEESYVAGNPDVAKLIELGILRDGREHYLNYGIDEDRVPRLARERAPVAGELERAFVSESGFFLLLGWLSDEGHAATRQKLVGPDFTIDIPASAVLRYARRDVEMSIRQGAFDFGFLTFAKCPSKFLLTQPFQLQAGSETGAFERRATPEIVSDRRLLETLLTLVATHQSHAGKEAGLYRFLAGPSGDYAVDLFRGHVAKNVASHYARTFRPRKVSRSFVTVLFGSTEAMLLQPVMFRNEGIDFGEWIYVCNSPEDANAALRLGRLISDLYDVMITVIIMTDNVGFGAANNVAVARASGASIYVINPDVFPLAAHAGRLRQTLRERELGSTLWGGLLFYDDHNLMHSGMRVEWDSFFHCPSLNKTSGPPASSFELARVEHFDKGVPFDEAKWRGFKPVPAITGALMAFSKPYFERLGGFSTRYIYGHYEDADLSLRWAAAGGAVVVDPGLRLIHLEGQGSRARGEQYQGAAMANRYLFSISHGAAPRATPSEPRRIADATRPEI